MGYWYITFRRGVYGMPWKTVEGGLARYYESCIEWETVLVPTKNTLEFIESRYLHYRNIVSWVPARPWMKETRWETDHESNFWDWV